MRVSAIFEVLPCRIILLQVRWLYACVCVGHWIRVWMVYFNTKKNAHEIDSGQAASQIVLNFHDRESFKLKLFFTVK